MKGRAFLTNLVGDLMIPKKKFAFGYNPEKDKVNIF
jgi:hypothetical protein